MHSSRFPTPRLVGMHQPQRIENARILIANTPMELAEKKMKDKVSVEKDTMEVVR